MKRLLSILAVILGLSCSGMGIDVSERGGIEPAPEPPSVNGNARLKFMKTLPQSNRIRSPWGLAFGVDGTLYVCDRGQSSIVRLDVEGNVLARFDSFGSRTERLFSPVDVCTSDGITVYAVDEANSRILRFDRNLRNAYVIYERDSEDNRLFGSLSGLAYDVTAGDLYATDRNSGAVIRIDMLSGNVRSMGAFGSGKDSLRGPAGLDVTDQGILFVADVKYGAVAMIRSFGAEISYIGEQALSAPLDTAVLPGGGIAVADEHGIVVLSESGNAEALAGFGTDRNMLPRSLAFHEGELYVSDALSGTILVYRLESGLRK